jgi:hypothetical protein
MVVVAVGTNSQAGILNQLVLSQQASGSGPAPEQDATPPGPHGGKSAASGPAAAGLDSNDDDDKALGSLVHKTFLTRKLDDLAGSIGNVGISAAAAVFVINCSSYLLGLLSNGAPLSLGAAQHLQVRGASSVTYNSHTTAPPARL